MRKSVFWIIAAMVFCTPAWASEDAKEFFYSTGIVKESLQYEVSHRCKEIVPTQLARLMDLHWQLAQADTLVHQEFSDDEMADTVAFTKSPVGQKLIRAFETAGIDKKTHRFNSRSLPKVRETFAKSLTPEETEQADAVNAALDVIARQMKVSGWIAHKLALANARAMNGMIAENPALESKLSAQNLKQMKALVAEDASPLSQQEQDIFVAIRSITKACED